eukprot:3414234-Rhodomonas_salina.1
MHSRRVSWMLADAPRQVRHAASNVAVLTSASGFRAAVRSVCERGCEREGVGPRCSHMRAGMLSDG